jgi:segregation and condensation protein B
MNPVDLKTIAESLVFAAGNPISLRRLSEVIGVAQTEVKPALTLLREEYEASGRGIIFAEVAGGYQLRTSPDNAEYVKVLLQEKPSKLSRAALETLAIIAYRQPITKIEIESVRGVTVDGVLNSLLIKKLIREMGRKDVPGRPWVYGTTPQFLELFGLSDLSGLPPLPDIHEPTLNPLADDALNDTIENALESNESSATDAGGDPDYYAEDTQSPTSPTIEHALEPNEQDTAPQYELSDESSTPAGEELSDLTRQQVPKTNENGTGPEPSGEVNLSRTTEQAADSITDDEDAISGREDASSPPSEEVLESSRPETGHGESGSTPEPNGEANFSSTVEQASEPGSEQTEQTFQAGETDTSPDDGDSPSRREDILSPASEQADESTWAEAGESGTAPESSREAIFSPPMEQVAEPANEQTLQADEADTITGSGDVPSRREGLPSPASEQLFESSRTETGENGTASQPSGEADFSPPVEQATDSASGQTLQAGESDWTEASESGSASEPSGETDAIADDGDTSSGREDTPSVTSAQAPKSSRSDLAPESGDADPSRQGSGERGDDNASGDDSESET